jgi:Fusaric acid resistance protein family
VTLVQSISRSFTIAGFPLATWAFALRIWAAMMVALYAAFWLQLESASSAAVTVAIPRSELLTSGRGEPFGRQPLKPSTPS